MILLTNIGRLYTATPSGVFRDATVLIDGALIAWVGSARPGPPPPLAARVTETHDLAGGLVTPGLIDAHTHPLYAGDRMAEVARRSAGASYAELATAGGGILATVSATRAAGEAALRDALVARLRSWLSSGTTTLEAKTGYHLDRSGELAALRLLGSVRELPDVPDLAITFLGAHAVPPEMAGRQEEYAQQVAAWCSEAAAAGARFCDVFCDAGYFTVAQARQILNAGRAAGLEARLHADELARTGGASLAAVCRAASADHLLRIDAADAAALAGAGVVATLAPGTALSMGCLPPARMLFDAGVVIALGTDHNAGTCGMTSMSLVIALAVATLRLSADEALTAATRGGAQSLRLADRGTVEVGRRADLVLWDAEHEGAFAWAYGLRALRVWKVGAEVRLRK